MPPPTTSDPVDWYPARLLRKRRRPEDHGDGDACDTCDESACDEQRQQPNQKTTTTTTTGYHHDQQREHFALVVLNQPLTDVPTLKRLWENSSWRLAADGGANRLLDVLNQQRQEELARKRAGPRTAGKAPRRQDDRDKAAQLDEAEADDDDDDSVWHNASNSTKKNLDIIIGDLDSLSSEARTHFTTLQTQIIHDPDQESTDFGKAVHYIHAHSHTNNNSNNPPLDIVVLGGLGGRVDQGLSQLHHLYLYQPGPAGYARGRLFLVSENSLTFLLKGSGGDGGGNKKRWHRIHVREEEEGGGGGDAGDGDKDVLFDKYVGIIPVKEPSVITTRGLEWDVTDWATEFGGRMSTSNHVLPGTKVVEVATAKDVLFTIALLKKEE